MYKILNYLQLRLGIDKAIFWSIVNKVFGIIKAPVTIYFLVKYLSPEEMGLWYTFTSLGALTVFAELGFVMIITQFVSHEFGKLNETKRIINRKSTNIDRLIGLIRFSIKFYLYIIPLAILILITAGYFYFNTEPNIIYYTWICFSIVGGLTLFAGLLQAIYQGLDKVKEIQIIAFIGALIGTFFNWGMLMLDFKIWALVFGNLVGIITATILLYNISPGFWQQVIVYNAKVKFNFLKETLPLQGKYAISWISGYFIFFLYVPATYKFIGPIQAGQLGITMSVIAAITAVSANWVSTKIPKFNILVAKKNKSELDQLFNKAIFQGLFVQIFLFIILIFSLFVLNIFLPEIAKRFLDFRLTLLLIFPQIAYYIISSLAIYLRAHKQEPFVWISIVNALLMSLAVFVILKNYQMSSFFWSVNVIYWIVILPFSYYVFALKKREYTKLYY